MRSASSATDVYTPSTGPIARADIPGVVDIIPTYRSLLVEYDASPGLIREHERRPGKHRDWFR